MKFAVEREQLLRALQLVTGVVERRQTLPVLSNVLLRASAASADEPGRLEMVGTDLEVELAAVCPVTVEQAGEITVPARKLADIWRSLPEGVDVSVQSQGDRTTVRSGRSRFSLSTLPASDFPRLEGGANDVVVELAQGQLKTLLGRVSFAMAQQDVRYFLNGMLLEVTSGHTRGVATDGHRLAMCTLARGVAEVDRIQAIVPRKGVLEISRLLEDDEGTVELQLGANHMHVQLGPFRLTTKLVDGQFPDYENVIPRDIGKSISGDRSTLRGAFQRASILSNEKYRGVRLNVEGERLTIRANNPEQEEAEEIVAVDYAGEPLELGFNVTYLQDVLAVLPSDDVRLGVSDRNGSAVIETADDAEALYVVMPMRL